MNRTSLSRTLVVLAVLGCCALAVPNGAGASPSFALDSDLKHIHRAEPGEKFSDTIQVRNTQESTLVVKAILTDYRREPGYSDYQDPGSLQRSLADWFSFTPKRVELEPDETGEFTYTVQVPEDPQLTGSYWTGLMLEPADPETYQPSGESSRALGLSSLVRYMVSVIVNIGDSGSSQIEFVEATVEPFPYDDGEGSPHIEARVKNKGTRLDEFVPRLKLFSSAGKRIENWKGLPVTVYPGGSQSVKLPIERLSPGEYSALLIFDTGEDQTTAGVRFSFEVDEPTEEELADMKPDSQQESEKKKEKEKEKEDGTGQKPEEGSEGEEA